MKLIHTKLARSIWLFDIRDLNPKGKDIAGDLVEWITESYGFAVAPDPDNPVQASASGGALDPQSAPAQQAPGGLLFQRGRFQTQKEVFVEIVALTIYNDGIVIDTASSTADGDRFAEDLLSSAANEFSLTYDRDTVRRKLYLSELIVRSDLALESLNPALAAFAAGLPKSFANGQSLRFGVGSIAFWSEPNDAGIHRIIRIERQLGRAFSEHRLYSQAPMATDDHLALLQSFEESFGQKS